MAAVRRLVSSKNVLSISLLCLFIFLILAIVAVNHHKSVPFIAGKIDQVGSNKKDFRLPSSDSFQENHRPIEEKRVHNNLATDNTVAMDDNYVYNLIGDDEPYLKMAQEHVECTEGIDVYMYLI